MTAFNGSFRLVSSENYGTFLTEIGVPVETRKQVASSLEQIKIAGEADSYTITTTVLNKESSIRFELGTGFEEERLNGAVTETVVNLENGALVQKYFGDKESTATYTIDGDTLTIVETAGTVTATRTFKRH
ncbi:lipocalin/fatty-acid binding family protein [Streptomyces lavendulae]